MPRFSGAFGWRKSTAEEFYIAETSPDQSSFRVLERNQPADGRTFDGGVKMSRPNGQSQHRPTNSDPAEADDNIFAGLNANRGSGSSNTTKATSTASSRHSNASTAPSSADASNAHDDRAGKRKQAKEIPPRPLTKSSTSSFLDRAGRTFSFGGQKKHTVPPPNQDGVPDVPAIPVFQREDEFGRTRALTASTTSTATPPKLDESSDLDMGGDFGSMFSRFDKRASTITLKNEAPPGQFANGQRQAQPAPLKLDTTTPIEPPAASWNSHNSRDNLMSATSPRADYDRPPPVPRHQPSFEYRASASPEGVVEDEDARLLADSVLAGKFVADGPRNDTQAGRYRRETDQFSAAPRKTMNSGFEKEDNMFAGTAQRFSKPAHVATTRKASDDNGKVMTPAEFERYRLDKEREGMYKAANPSADNDDEDEINYDDEEDEEDKLKQQAKQRRNQQASMAAYRQKNMKTTGELRSTSPLPARIALPTSLSAPHLALPKTPSPEPVRHGRNDDDEDEDIPLGILQAHGFPNKNRQSNQLTSFGSNPNLRASAFLSAGRPASTLGDPSGGPAKRHSTLPAFARNLPQDPFVGASIAKPAMRESLAMGGGSQTHLSPMPQQQQGSVPPGGLVGVIASEERSRAMRRGSPNMESQKLMNGNNVDPITGIPSHMMYPGGGAGGGHLGMGGGVTGAQRPQQQLSVADQAQLQMNQQMTQFMQMQMQFMQMMSVNQQGGGQQQMPPQMPPQMMQQMMQQQQPGFAAPPSVADFSSGQSVMGMPANQPRRLDPSMRTMSMIQPTTSSSYLQGPGFGAPAPQVGYTPSIAPSERSNIGLPNRYRPVSQAGSMTGQMMHNRSMSMSGAMALSQAEDLNFKPTIKLVHSAKNQNNSDDDEEEGWESMRAKRDQKKSKWRFKKRGEDAN